MATFKSSKIVLLSDDRVDSLLNTRCVQRKERFKCNLTRNDSGLLLWKDNLENRFRKRYLFYSFLQEAHCLWDYRYVLCNFVRYLYRYPYSMRLTVILKTVNGIPGSSLRERTLTRNSIFCDFSSENTHKNDLLTVIMSFQQWSSSAQRYLCNLETVCNYCIYLYL